MAHGFLTPQDVSGESPIFGKIAKWLEDKWNEEREKQKKDKEEISSKLKDLEKAVEVNVRDVTQRQGYAQAPAYKMLSGSKPRALSAGQTALPPGGPRLPGSSDGPKKGGTYSNIPGIAPDGSGGLNASSFLNKETGDVEVEAAFKAGISPEDLKAAVRRGRAIKRAKGIALSGNGEDTAAQGTEALVKTRQEAIKTATAVNSPAITPDSGADIVAAVNKNTEAISTLVKVTKEQTSNDTKLSERSALTQEKLMGRQRAAAEERSLEEGKDMSGFLTPTMKKIEQQAKGGAGGGGMSSYDANMDRMTRAQEMLDIGSDIADMRKGKVRRITQGRDGRTPRQRLRDMQARRGGGAIKPRAGGGVKPRGRLGSLSRLGGAATKGGGALKGGSGALKGAALAGKATRGIPLLGVLTAGLEFGDRMSSGQNAFQAGAGTAGSVGGGLAGAAAGAAIGSIIPGVGTVIGGALGGLLGSMAGGGTADMLTGANKIPSGAGGMLSSGPLSGYMSLLHGTELTLSGNNKKETKNIGEALGEGMIMASLGPLNPKVLELSAKGMKHFYENMGGKDIMENIFKGVTDALGAVGNALGSVANSLLGGAAHAGTMFGGGLTNVGGATGEQNLAAFLSTMEASGNQNQADAFQVMLNRAADAQAGGSMKAYGTSLGDQITAREQFSPLSSAIYGVSADSAAAAKYGPISRALGNNPAERKAKLLEIASQPDGLAALQRLFKGGSAADAAKVLQDFKSGGALSQTSVKDIGSMLSFRGYRSGAGDFNRGAGGNFFFGQGRGKVGSLSQVSPGMVPSTGAGGSKLEEDILAFRQARTRFGVSGQRQATDTSFNLAIRELRGTAGGSSINPLADDLSYQDVHKGRAHKEGYGFDVPIANATQSKFVIDFFRSRGYETIHGRAEDPTGGHDHHVHVQAPHNRKNEFLASRGQNPRGTGQQRFNIPGAPELTAVLNQNQNNATPATPLTGVQPNLPVAATPTIPTPSPVAATPAAANTGTGVMQASAQTSGPVFQQPVTVVNNYNVAGQGGGGDVIPNTLGAGASMSSMGLESFSQLKLRSLG